MMPDGFSPGDPLLRELAYYKKQLDRIAGESVRHDFTLSSLRHELKQKKEAFSILTSLQKEFSVATPVHVIFNKTVKAVNTHLAMDRSVIFVPGATPSTFKAAHWYGVNEELVPMFEMRELKLPDSFLGNCQFILQNKSVDPDDISTQFQKIFLYQHFIAVPIRFDGKIIAFLLTGRQFEKNPFVPALDMTDVDTLTAIAGLISSVIQDKKMMEMKLQMKEQAEEKEEIIHLFGQQVSMDVARSLINARQDRAARKTVAVMFLDIRNFTPFVEYKPPEEVVRYLNLLFEFMIEIIDKYKGIVNQFLGDGFMTTFGAPIDDVNPFQNAVDAALEIHKILQQKIERNEIPATRIGIGIHGGEAITGNVGSTLRKQYTITGNVVIIAARIEQLTKQYNAQILVSNEVYRKTTFNGVTPKAIGEVQLKGLSGGVELYQVI